MKSCFEVDVKMQINSVHLQLYWAISNDNGIYTYQFQIHDIITFCISSPVDAYGSANIEVEVIEPPINIKGTSVFCVRF